MNRISALVLATALAAVAAAPASASSGGLTVRSVDSARTATPGLPVAVDVVVKPARRARGAKVSFYLSADARRGRGDVRLRGRPPVVPAGQALGDYRLIACVPKSCRATRRPLSVTEKPVGTRGLVEQAVAAGKLKPEQGLVYRAFAAFGDPRLPAAYAGDETAREDVVMRDILEAWPRLSSTQRAHMRPLLTPPAARSARASGRAGAAAVCDSNQLAKPEWRSLAKPGGHVRLWWLKGDEARIGPRARSFVAEIENHMWPKLVAVFGREPLKDGAQRCFHGLDDKLDIYIHRIDRKTALTVPYPPRCAGTPAFIVFNGGNHLPDNWEMAHELTHAFQFAYRYADACNAHDNWDEAIANWGASYLYPKDNSEHVFRWLSRDPHASLADASYEGWVFPYAMQQLHGTGPIRSIYAQTERVPVLDAIDAGAPGGMRKAWPEFARAAWNAEPVSPNFVDWDSFPQGPEVKGRPIAMEQTDVGFAGQNEIEIKPPEKPLSRAYKHLKFAPGVRMVTALGPTNPDIQVEALIKFRDGTTKTEELTRKGLKIYCPETPAKRVDEMLLVLSNTSLYQPAPADATTKVVASNIGCARYTGTASGVARVHWGRINTTETWSATGLVFQRYPTGENNHYLGFKLVAGTVNWSFTGNHYDCALRAGPVNLRIKPDGSQGALDIETWLLKSPIRRYRAWGFDLPTVTGTGTCMNGSHPWNFKPHTFLETFERFARPEIPPDGVLQGSWSGDDGGGESRSISYKWRLEPEG